MKSFFNLTPRSRGVLYIWQYDALNFQKFAREVLGLTAFGHNFEIIRERNNIDLWIGSAEDIIVIDNKIKSSLNGIKFDHYSQLNKYQDYTEQRISDPEDDVCGKVAHYYIFAPDYNLFDIAKYQLKKPYWVVKYSAAMPPATLPIAILLIFSRAYIITLCPSPNSTSALCALDL